jgi:hypothetical protein
LGIEIQVVDCFESAEAVAMPEEPFDPVGAVLHGVGAAIKNSTHLGL